ncbi:MAG: S-layer homology domain-containing protein [Clostridiales bacterium]|nr:S-layer homology domain-containing protein [Clostridiales bacterium]
MRRKATAILLSVVMALGAAAPSFAAPASNNRQQAQQQQQNANRNNNSQRQNANRQQETKKQAETKEPVTETTTQRQAATEKQTVKTDSKQNNKQENRVTEQTREALTEATTEYVERETQGERPTLAEDETRPERETLAEGETRPERPTLAEGETLPEPPTDEEGNPIQFKDGEKPDFDRDGFDLDDDDRPDFDDFDFDDDDRDDWDDDREDRRDFDDDDFDEDAPPFEDVEREAWYYKYVKKAYKKGYISGKNEKNFAPNETVTGAELIVMLFRAEGNTLGPVLAEKRWYQNAIDWAWENNILTDEIKDFDPDAAVTREQVMYILCRYLFYRGFETKSNNDLKEFNDRDRISDYAVSSAGLLVDEGIISGTNGNLNPEESLTRAESAVMLVKIFEEILDE